MDESLSQDNEKERETSVIHLANVQRNHGTSASPIETRLHQLQQDEVEIARLKEQSPLLKENFGKKVELENEELKSRTFCLENMTGGDSISFYTGFPNMETFQASPTYLDPINTAKTFVTGFRLNLTLKKESIMMGIISKTL